MSRFFILLGCFVVSSVHSNGAWSSPIPDPSYDRFFPHYAEICGFGKMTHGNSGGHGLLYLKGVCRDRNSDLPLVRNCTAEELESNPQMGTALSVDPVATNVKWFAIENIDFVFFGSLAPEQALDSQTHEKIKGRAIEEQLYTHVEPRATILKAKPIAMPIEDYLADQSFGTDFGIALAREGSCWKIPVSTEQVDTIIQVANRMNLEITKDQPAYFDFLSDNCIHFAVNLLAAAGVLDETVTRQSFPMSLGNIELPTSRMYKIGRKVQKEIPGVEEAFRDPLIHQTLLQFRRLPLQFGTILEEIPFHDEGNPSFQRSGRLAFPGQLKKLKKMEADPQFTDLKTHLENYREKLNRAHAGFAASPLKSLVDSNKYLRNSEFAAFYKLYGEWLKRTSLELDQLLTPMANDLNDLNAAPL